MRRTVGTILAGTGAFFLALAPLVRFYVGDRLIAAPVDFYQRSVLRAENASYFDRATQKMRQGVTLTAVSTTRGDVRSSNDDIAVWDTFTSIEDPVTKANVEIQTYRSVFDRRTAKLLSTRGASVGGDASVRQTGIGVWWPFGVQKRTYQHFDVATRRTWPMVFSGEEKVHGMRAYRFSQRVEATKIETIRGGVPASLLGMKKVERTFPGLDRKTGNVAADRYYRATVTAWVDPRTGTTINQEQRVTSTLRTLDGVDRLTVADLNLRMTDPSRRQLADYAKEQGRKIVLIKTVGPLGGGLLGAVLLLAGLLLSLTGRRDPAGSGASERAPATTGTAPAGDASRSGPEHTDPPA